MATMTHRQQRKTTTTAKLGNLDVLLIALRADLGPDWGCYKELIEGAADAKANGENVSAWVDQIEPLVRNTASQFAHQGVLFLLGIKVGSEVNVQSAPPPDIRRPAQAAQPSANMQSNFNPTWTPIPSPSSSSYIPPTPTSVASKKRSAANVAFQGQKQATATQPLKSDWFGGYVLHQDPAFRRDVFEFFGHEVPDKPDPKHHDQSDVSSVYKAADDDLAVWRAGAGAEGEVKDGAQEGQKDMIKSVEDAKRERVREGLRFKLFDKLD
ncbi:hypothetical protein J4E83_010495 [Alternaria metachromatica]|uniref:uncharacterized protein n=1 Tax=Alternaria metachromatica TaxID=283354 RepID=UPI0020C2F908|nr:uncharacterized protein J4E83_010495 [Alternaria metachromatica]KAI4605603.1 hypothetical protein J4E83_010495 [Alternaria metachromatica]